jgi:hypothetical protein
MNKADQDFAYKAARSILAPFYTMIGILVGFFIMYIVCLTSGVDTALIKSGMMYASLSVVGLHVLWVFSVFKKIKKENKERMTAIAQAFPAPSFNGPIGVDGNGMVVVKAKKSAPKPTGNLKKDYAARRAYMSERLDEMEETDPSLARSGRRILNLPKVVADNSDRGKGD